MVDPIAKLEAALRVNAALLVHAQRLIAAYIAPESDRAAIISELIRLLDGPPQREAKRLAEGALGEANGAEEEEPALTLQIRNLPPRFWAQVLVVGTTGVLFVVSPFRPDWIEAICGGFDPDQHSGSIDERPNRRNEAAGFARGCVDRRGAKIAGELFVETDRAGRPFPWRRSIVPWGITTRLTHARREPICPLTGS
jgi:hypothetical protein